MQHRNKSLQNTEEDSEEMNVQTVWIRGRILMCRPMGREEQIVKARRHVWQLINIVLSARSYSSKISQSQLPKNYSERLYVFYLFISYMLVKHKQQTYTKIHQKEIK